MPRSRRPSPDQKSSSDIKNRGLHLLEQVIGSVIGSDSVEEANRRKEKHMPNGERSSRTEIWDLSNDQTSILTAPHSTNEPMI